MKKNWLINILIVVWFLSACSIVQNNRSTSDSVLVPPTQTWEVKTTTPKSTLTAIPTIVKIPTETITYFLPETTPTGNPYYTPTPGEQNASAVSYNPLTGLIVDDENNLTRRPIMVKISNYPREIRPQAGWSMADIIFEYYLGEGMNRFLAVFYGENPEWAGPIRSGRLVDAQLGMMYESILVYGGADDRVDLVLKNPGILGDRAIDTRYTEVCPPICGEDTHSLEGVFVNPKEMSSYAMSHGIDQGTKYDSLNGMVFDEQIPQSETQSAEITFIISNVCKSRWVYNEKDGNYLRWEESGDFEENMIPSTDIAVDNKQLAYENIVVLFSDYIVYDVMLHDIAVVYEDTQLPAKMWRDGLMYSGFWTAEEGKPIQLWSANGERYIYKPGRTWYVFVTEETEIEETVEGSWLVTFFTP